MASALCSLGSITLARCAADLPLRLVIEGKPKRIPEGHQGPLHRVGLRFLEGGFVGLAQVGVDAMAGAAAPEPGLSGPRR